MTVRTISKFPTDRYGFCLPIAGLSLVRLMALVWVWQAVFLEGEGLAQPAPGLTVEPQSGWFAGVSRVLRAPCTLILEGQRFSET
jgi:hypothetical protein